MMTRQGDSKVSADLLHEQREKIAAEKSPEQRAVAALDWAIKKVRAAFDPGTESLFKGMRIVEDNHKRRQAKLWLLTERIRKMFIPDGVTSRQTENDAIKLTFRQGYYVDHLGKKREHRWKITIGSEDLKSEGECPACGGEIETEILEDNSYRVGCDDCGYEHSPFCGVEVDE